MSRWYLGVAGGAGGAGRAVVWCGGPLGDEGRGRGQRPRWCGAVPGTVCLPWPISISSISKPYLFLFPSLFPFFFFIGDSLSPPSSLGDLTALRAARRQSAPKPKPPDGRRASPRPPLCCPRFHSSSPSSCCSAPPLCSVPCNELGGRVIKVMVARRRAATRAVRGRAALILRAHSA